MSVSKTLCAQHRSHISLQLQQQACIACSWLMLSTAFLAELLECRGVADGQSGPAAMAAWAARRWLARNAAGVKAIRSHTQMAASACTSLVLCLPALEDVNLSLPGLLEPDDLGCLLEALSWRRGLRVLNLSWIDEEDEAADDAIYPATHCAPAFAKLRGLTKLTLNFGVEDREYAMIKVVGALAALTGLLELKISFYRSAVVPATLAQLKELRTIEFCGLDACVLETGCLNLPNLVSLAFDGCAFCDTDYMRVFRDWVGLDYLGDTDEIDLLPGVTALQSLTQVTFSGQAPLFLAQLAQLPRLEHVVLRARGQPFQFGDRLALPRLPADMSPLSTSLSHLEFSGHGLTQFPLAVTQLAALQCLRAGGNEFSQLPAAITVLSRLTELTLGRLEPDEDRLQLRKKRCLDVRALGDLSSFPALRVLAFASCEVIISQSILNAMQHASLASMSFQLAHPAPGCALAVMLLSTLLRGQGRGSVLTFVSEDYWWTKRALKEAQGRAPFQKFLTAMEACGL